MKLPIGPLRRLRRCFDQPQRMANSFRNDRFRNPSTLAWFVSGLLGISIVSSFFFVVSAVIYIFAPDLEEQYVESGPVILFYLLVDTFSVVQLPLRILTATVFLIWIYRTYNNLAALKVSDLAYSPEWAVGFWFIPIVNLFRPYQIVREIFTKSSVDLVSVTGPPELNQESPVELGFWWGAFLASGFFYQISGTLYGTGDRANSEYFAAFDLGGSLTAIAAGLLAIYLVREITGRQKKRAEFLERTFNENNAPPPPPMFGGNQ
jgi:hypothetical protein